MNKIIYLKTIPLEYRYRKLFCTDIFYRSFCLLKLNDNILLNKEKENQIKHYNTFHKIIDYSKNINNLNNSIIFKKYSIFLDSVNYIKTSKRLYSYKRNKLEKRKVIINNPSIITIPISLTRAY